MKNISETVLINSILEGDKEAFEELNKRYWNTAYLLCYQRTGNREDAKDIAQEALIRVYKYLGQLRDKTKFAGWFYRIVFQLLNERYRQGKFRNQQSLDYDLEEKDVNNPMENLQVRDALKTLPEDARLVITLRFYKDMSCAEIAEHLGEPVGTVTSRLHRAYQALKEKLL